MRDDVWVQSLGQSRTATVTGSMWRCCATAFSTVPSFCGALGNATSASDPIVYAFVSRASSFLSLTKASYPQAATVLSFLLFHMMD
jgi:hypothetical protein